jgi:hypothetical protein
MFSGFSEWIVSIIYPGGQLKLLISYSHTTHTHWALWSFHSCGRCLSESYSSWQSSPPLSDLFSFVWLSLFRPYYCPADHTWMACILFKLLPLRVCYNSWLTLSLWNVSSNSMVIACRNGKVWEWCKLTLVCRKEFACLETWKWARMEVRVAASSPGTDTDRRAGCFQIVSSPRFLFSNSSQAHRTIFV